MIAVNFKPNYRKPQPKRVITIKTPKPTGRFLQDSKGHYQEIWSDGSIRNTLSGPPKKSNITKIPVISEIYDLMTASKIVKKENNQKELDLPEKGNTGGQGWWSRMRRQLANFLTLSMFRRKI